MRNVLSATCALVLLALAPAQVARAQETKRLEGKPFQLALFDPVQIVPADQGISGVGIDLIYGKNAFLRGVEAGLVNDVAGDVLGAQWGLVNIAGGNFVGLQDGLIVSITHGRMEGWQSGLVTIAGSTSGFQIGLVNHAESARGLQLGLVNHTVTMNGIQIGLVNIIERGGWLPACIIVNGSFP